MLALMLSIDLLLITLYAAAMIATLR